MTAWSETLRPVKRALSNFEKSSFPVPLRPGRFLILPAQPKTEIEELITIGADYGDIVAIEREQANADQLYEYYFDLLQVHWIEVSAFIERARTNEYSYVHLDYCGHMKDDEVGAIAATARILAPQSRVRVSLLRNRKTAPTERFEAMIRENMLLPLVGALAAADPRLGWEELMASFSDSSDTTQLVAAVCLLSHFFGIDPWVYADQAASGDTTVPPVMGQHWIYNVQRWHYHEAGHPGAMETVWLDMMHRPESMQLSAEAIPGQLYSLLWSLTHPVPQYATTLGEVDDSDEG